MKSGSLVHYSYCRLADTEEYKHHAHGIKVLSCLLTPQIKIVILYVLGHDVPPAAPHLHNPPGPLNPLDQHPHSRNWSAAPCCTVRIQCARAVRSGHAESLSRVDWRVGVALWVELFRHVGGYNVG